MFLSKAEWDYLTSNRQFDDDYSYTIKSRLVKKINQFANQELPLLIEKGYLTEFCKLTDNRKVQQGEGSSLVGRGIANPGGDSSGFREKEKVKERGEWDFRSVSVLRRKFEPTRPFGHGISNPTPYQARRPPQFDKVFCLMY